MDSQIIHVTLVGQAHLFSLLTYSSYIYGWLIHIQYVIVFLFDFIEFTLPDGFSVEV